MLHTVAQTLASGAIVAIVFGLPALYFLFTERFRRLPTAQELSTLFAVLALAGLILGLPALAVLGASVLVAIGISWIMAEVALDNVQYERTLAPPRLFPGEETRLHISVRNYKFLPLAWLRIVDPIDIRVVRNDHRLDDVLTFSGGIERDDDLGRSLVTLTALGAFRALERTYTVTALKRGVYILGPARAESGDPFGIFPRKATLGTKQEIIVYPSIYRPEEQRLPFHEMIGEIRPERALVEDPTFLAGGREYQPGDPLHRMNWKATARSGKLQVRLFDPTTTANLLLVLNLNTYEYLWQGVDLDRMESAISAAASLAAWAADNGYAVGLRATGTIGNSDSALRIAPAAHPQQAATIFDHLARLTFNTRFPTEQVLLDEIGRLEARTSLIFVTPILTERQVDILLSRSLRGRVSVLFTSPGLPPGIPGLPVHRLAPSGESVRAVS